MPLRREPLPGTITRSVLLRRTKVTTSDTSPKIIYSLFIFTWNVHVRAMKAGKGKTLQGPKCALDKVMLYL